MKYYFVFRNSVRSILITATVFGAATLAQAEKNPSTHAGSSSSSSSNKEQKSADQSKNTQSKKQGNSAQAQDNYTYCKDPASDYRRTQGAGLMYMARTPPVTTGYLKVNHAKRIDSTGFCRDGIKFWPR